jgi:hypothetical protein
MSKGEQVQQPKWNAERRNLFYRQVSSVLLIVLAVVYITSIIAGHLPENRRIDTVTLLIVALITVVVIVLLRPGTFNRLKLLELSGFKLEMLEEVKEQQKKQGSELADIALILPLLLPETERRHLLNLANNTTSDYKGNHSVRSELRRLRSIGLLRMRPNHTISQMNDNRSFDLAEYIELTPLGLRWVNRIHEIEQEGVS